MANQKIYFKVWDSKESFHSSIYKAELVTINRKTIYGQRKILARDKDSNECFRALYDENDMTLYPQKSIGSCRLNKDGTIYKKKISKKSTSFINEFCKNFKYEGKKPWEDKMEFRISYFNFIEKYPSYIYTLKGPDVAELAQRIGTDIYSSDRSFIGSYSDRRYFTPVLFQRNSIIFLVMYEAMNCGDYAEKSISYQLDDISLLTDFESLDEIDFAMFD